MNRRNNRREAVCDGSSFDSFLDEEGIREEAEATAIKRVLAWQLERAMREQQKTKKVMAKQLCTVKTKRE
jgi:antitoxin HicB